MYKHFLNYYWKKGKPYGINEVEPAQAPMSFRIVVDPYYKRFTLEKYSFDRFEKIIYDSLLLDFRQLTLGEQIAWNRHLVHENDTNSTYLLRNQEDRVVLKETLSYEKHFCRTCHIHSVHEIPLASHRMYYCALNDPFNGVVLYDLENQPVMLKIYEFDSETFEFTTLLKEVWDMQETPEELKNYAASEI